MTPPAALAPPLPAPVPRGRATTLPAATLAPPAPAPLPSPAGPPPAANVIMGMWPIGGPHPHDHHPRPRLLTFVIMTLVGLSPPLSHDHEAELRGFSGNRGCWSLWSGGAWVLGGEGVSCC
jgi:anti-sigma factor RsiW